MKPVVLIPNWKKAWKFASVQISALGAVLMLMIELAGQAWISLPPHAQTLIPYSQHIALVLFVLGIFGRVLKLPEKKSDDE